MKQIFIALIIAIVTSSCVSTAKVKVNTPYANGLPLDTLNLVATMIGPVLQPVLPLIDAAAFNGKTNQIADQILDEQQKAIEVYKEILIKDLVEKVHKPVRTGADFTSAAADKYRVKNGVTVDNKNFPIIFFGQGDVNFIDFGKGKNMNAILSDDKLKGRIAKLATDLKVKTILVCYNRLNVVGAGAFGSSGNLRLETFLFLYDSNGKPLMDAQGWSKITSIGGKKLEDYKMQLDSFRELSGLLTTELAKFIK